MRSLQLTVLLISAAQTVSVRQEFLRDIQQPISAMSSMSAWQYSVHDWTNDGNVGETLPHIENNFLVPSQNIPPSKQRSWNNRQEQTSSEDVPLADPPSHGQHEEGNTVDLALPAREEVNTDNTMSDSSEADASLWLDAEGDEIAYLSHHIVQRDLMSELDFTEEGSGSTDMSTIITEPATLTTEPATLTTAAVTLTTAPPTTTLPPDNAAECQDSDSCEPQNHERCRPDKNGVKRCECLPGYARHEPGGLCIPVTAKSAVVELIDVEWADSLKNPDSAYYKEIESDLVRLMEKAFTSETMGQDHPAVTYVVAAVSSFSLATGRSQTRSRRQTELSQITAGLFVYYEAEEFPGFSDTEMNKVLDEELAKDDLYDSLTVITIDNIVDTSVGTADACADGNNYCDVMASTCEPWDNQTWFTCECKEGYDDVGIGMEWGVDPGEECQLAIEATPTPSDVCPDAFCLDNGVCSADHSADGTSEQFRCQCEFWYLGDRCSYNIGIIIAVTGASLTFYIIIMTITIMVYRYHKRSRKLILPSSDGSDHGEIYSQRSVDQASVGGLRPHGRNVSDCIEGASAQPSSETVGESSMDRWLGNANILNPPSVAGTNEQLGSVSSLHSTEILLPRPHVYGRSGIASPWNVTDELVDESADSMTSRRLREVENTVYF